MNKKTLLIILFITIALSLGACSGRRLSASGWSEITIEGDRVYFANGPHAYALDINSGNQIWQFPLEPINGADFYAAPVLADGTDHLLIAGYDKTLHSINPTNGLERWSFTGAGNRYIATPLVVDDLIYAPNADGTLYVLDLNGNLAWKFSSEDPLWASPIWSESCDCIYQASMDHYLYALDPDSGQLRWKTADLGGPIVSQPALADNGLIILGTFNNQIIALDENSRKVVWQLDTEDWAWASPVIDQDQVYVSDISGNIYALELETGNTLWKIQPGGGIVSAPLVLEDMIYFSTDASSLVVVNRDGVIQRNQPIEGQLYASPAAGSEKIFLSPSLTDFMILALNQSGVQVWAFPPAE